MNKSIIASVLGSILLAGCNGDGSSFGSDDTTTTTTIDTTSYTWQIVQLVSVDEADLDDSCVIYDDGSTDGKVISAVVADDDYYILYHNADGSVSDSFEASTYTDGLVTITNADIPDDGYVSLKEVAGGINVNPAAYMFSVQKSLLSDLVINVRSTQSGNRCYAGDDYRDAENVETSDVAVIDVSQPSDTVAYYQTSYGENFDSDSDLNSVSGQDFATYIPVLSPLPAEHDVLVSTFGTYDSSTEEKSNLSYYGFFDEDYIYEYDEDNNIDEYGEGSGTGRLDAVTTSLTWSYSTGVTFTNNTVYAIHDDRLYYWQLLNNTDEISVGDTGDVTNWSAYTTGSENTYSWDFINFESFNADSSTISFDLPDLGDINNVTLEKNCSLDVDDDSTNDAVDNCLAINSAYSDDDFSLQRTTVYVVNSNGSVLYQSVYAPVTSDPIVLSNTEGIELETANVSRIEVNLMKTDVDDDDAIQYLMIQNMDKVKMAEDERGDILGTSFQDTNGIVATADQINALDLRMFKSTTLVVKKSNQL